MSDVVGEAQAHQAWMKQVEALCGERSLQLTALRRQILLLVAAADAPVTAYALIDGLAKAQGRPVAPPTVYRTLDFLVENGFVVRVESRNAFAICDTPGHDHHGVMLICSRCGTAREVDDHALDEALRQTALRSGFKLERQMVELEGLCERCCAA